MGTLLGLTNDRGNYGDIMFIKSIRDSQEKDRENQGIPSEILAAEKWHHVIGYKGLYDVSTAGRIRNASTGKIKIPTQDQDDYMRVSLHKNGYPINHWVHILVGRAFKRNPKKKKEINHKNKVRWHNWVDNLEWNTRSENMIHCWKYRNVNK